MVEGPCTSRDLGVQRPHGLHLFGIGDFGSHLVRHRKVKTGKIVGKKRRKGNSRKGSRDTTGSPEKPCLFLNSTQGRLPRAIGKQENWSRLFPSDNTIVKGKNPRNHHGDGYQPANPARPQPWTHFQNRDKNAAPLRRLGPQRGATIHKTSNQSRKPLRNIDPQGDRPPKDLPGQFKKRHVGKETSPPK